MGNGLDKEFEKVLNLSWMITNCCKSCRRETNGEEDVTYLSYHRRPYNTIEIFYITTNQSNNRDNVLKTKNNQKCAVCIEYTGESHSSHRFLHDSIFRFVVRLWDGHALVEHPFDSPAERENNKASSANSVDLHK